MNELELVTEKMIAGGECLCKQNGKTVLVSGALPDETVSATVTEEKRDFIRAKVTRVLSPSVTRIVPRCEYYGMCGGCNLQFTDIETQRTLKARIVRESLVRAGVGDAFIPPITVVGGDEWEYRSRFQLHDGGLKEKSSRSVVKLGDCPVAVRAIREYLRNNPCVKNERLHLFASDKGVVSASRHREQTAQKNGVVAQNQSTGLQNKKMPKNYKKSRAVFSGSVKNERTACTVTVCGVPVSFDVQGFFQSNIPMLEKTVELITRNMGGARCADVYSGVGTFSVFLADRFEELYLIEHNREALIFAEQNLRGKKHFSYGISGAKWAALNEAQKHFDAVVIDPPRSGMEKEVRAWLKTNLPPQIRALSCDPVTFARDCADLLSAGYAIESLTLLDYYPQTSHIETLANLVRL